MSTDDRQDAEAIAKIAKQLSKHLELMRATCGQDFYGYFDLRVQAKRGVIESCHVTSTKTTEMLSK